MRPITVVRRCLAAGMLTRVPRGPVFLAAFAVLAGGCGGGAGSPGGVAPGVDGGAPAPHLGPGDVLDVGVGDEHSCALLAGGRVRCWGAARGGRLGYGNANDIGDNELPAAAGDVPLGGRATAIAVGGENTCALLDNGTVRCWGVGRFGVHGHGHMRDVGDDETPASAGDVALGAKAVEIAASGINVCAILETGAVRCWGHGLDGKLGTKGYEPIGDDEPPSAAMDVALPGRVIALAGLNLNMCALLESRAVICWGYDYSRDSLVTTIPLPANVSAIATGSRHGCALLDDGRLRCWGRGGAATAYQASASGPALTEVDVPIGAAVVAVDTGQDSTCVLLAGGAVRCWGQYAYRLGLGHDGDQPSPAKGDVAVGGRVKKVDLGRVHTCVLLESGHVKCWGTNYAGNLGYGNREHIGDDEVPSSVGPVPVSL